MLTFDTQPATALNHARLKHLETLGLNIRGQTVLELGSGVGHLTSFWVNRSVDVLSLELQRENVEEHRRRHPNHKVTQHDVFFGLDWFGNFDIVFCYGLLYHVSDPLRLINDMVRVARRLVLIETMVTPSDDAVFMATQHWAGRDQGNAGLACIPPRPWVLRSLRDAGWNAYVTRTQPRYNEFPLSWPSKNNLCRAIFVASPDPLNLPTLQENLPMEQEAAP